MTMTANFHSNKNFRFYDSLANRGTGTIQMQLFNSAKDDWTSASGVTVYLNAERARALGVWLIEQAHQVDAANDANAPVVEVENTEDRMPF